MIFGWLFSLLPRQSCRILVSTFTESPSRPLASDTLDSPNLSRRLSAADKACCQRWRRPSSSKSPCRPGTRTTTRAPPATAPAPPVASSSGTACGFARRFQYRAAWDQTVGAGDRREIFVAQLQLESASVEVRPSRRRRPTISDKRISVDSSWSVSAVSSL